MEEKIKDQVQQEDYDSVVIPSEYKQMHRDIFSRVYTGLINADASYTSTNYKDAYREALRSANAGVSLYMNSFKEETTKQ